MEYLEYYKEMKDAVKEIQELETKVYYNMGKHSQLVIDLFEEITEDIEENSFNAGATLYNLENVLEIFDPAKKDDIEALEQLKEKLERLNKVVL